VTLDTLAALLFAVGLSILRMTVRAARAPIRRLGELPGGAFGDAEAHPDVRVHPTMLVARPDAALFFANADAIVESVYADATEAEPPEQAVVLDPELTDDLDVPGAEALLMLSSRLADAGIALGLARAHGPVLELLERTAFVDAIGSDHVGGTRRGRRPRPRVGLTRTPVSGCRPAGRPSRACAGSGGGTPHARAAAPASSRRLLSCAPRGARCSGSAR
jgi:MFS superfamily sulfate permease-like transporter